MESESSRKDGQDAILDHRVVQHLGLNLLSAFVELGCVPVGKLPSDSTVAHCDRRRTHQDAACFLNNVGAHPAQRAVCQRSRLRRDVNGRIELDLGVARQHIEVRDTNVVQEQKAIICSIISLLWSNVANDATRKGLAGLNVADLNNNGMRTTTLALDDELRHDNGVICGSAQTTNPPLCRGHRGGMDDELLRRIIVGASRLESLNVGSVPELGLGVTSNDLEFFCRF